SHQSLTLIALALRLRVFINAILLSLTVTSDRISNEPNIYVGNYIEPNRFIRFSSIEPSHCQAS
ncbi:hypothetical protein ACVBKF_19885, partial [Shewanella sp. 0m-11]